MRVNYHKIAEYLKTNVTVAKIYIRILSRDFDFSTANKDSLLASDLKFLQELSLISEHTTRENNSILFAVDPRFSFPAILLNEMWNTDNSLHSFTDLISRQDLHELNMRYKLCNEIVRILEPYYKKELPFLKEMAVVVKGKKQIAACLSELLDTATCNIKAVISPPHLLGETIWQTIVEKMKNGVSYERVTVFDELPRHGYIIFKNEVEQNNETLFIYQNDRLSQKFYVINDILVLFFLPDSKILDFRFEVQIINNKGFADRFIKVFEEFAKDSLNLKDLLPFIAKLRDIKFSKAREILNETEFDWFTKIFDYGDFAILDYEISKETRRKCIENNLVFYEGERCYVKYSLMEVLDCGKNAN